MDIEAIVTKYAPIWDTGPERERIRAALTEMAAGYEQKIAGLESEAILSRALSERIRQLEVGRVPDGWQLVPIEPTPDMIDAVLWYANGDYLKLLGEDLMRIEIRHDWRAMLAAPRRCHLCDYQHGHKIGCVNNPVDIALRAASPQQKEKE